VESGNANNNCESTLSMLKSAYHRCNVGY